MKPVTNWLNRSVLGLLGLVLLAAGGLGLATGFGAFGSARAQSPVLSASANRWANDHGSWLWPVVAVVALVVLLLALRWLLAQLRTDRIREIELEGDRRHGATRLLARAVTDAVTEEIEGYRGVNRAAAQLRRDPRHPLLTLNVALTDRADLPDVRRRIEQDAVAHVREVIGVDELPTRLQLRLATGSGRRVH